MSAAICSPLCTWGKAHSLIPLCRGRLCTSHQQGTSSLIYTLVTQLLGTMSLWLRLCFWLGIYLLYLFLADLTAKPRAEPILVCSPELGIPGKPEFVAKYN